MTPLQIIYVALNSLGFVGVGIYITYLVYGLKDRIENLTLLAQEQGKTLEAVRERAAEADKLNEMYKKAVLDSDEMGKILDRRRSDVMKEYELAIQRKDKDLERYTELQLEEIEIKKRSLERLPELEKTLTDTIEQLNRQLRIIAPRQMSLSGQLTWQRHFLTSDSDDLILTRRAVDDHLTRRAVKVQRDTETGKIHFEEGPEIPYKE